MRGKPEEETRWKVMDVRFEHERDIEDLNTELVSVEDRIELEWNELSTGMYDYDLPKDIWILCLCQ